MANYEDDRLFELLTRLTGTLGSLLGRTTEVVLHDLRQLDESIIAVSGSQMTGRKVGDTIDALGLHIFQQHKFRDMANYETKTKSGKTLRSCTVFVNNAQGEAIGALCVNQDQSAMIKMRELLDETLGPEMPSSEDPLNQNVQDILSQLIQDAVRSTGKKIDDFSRGDKVAVISYLERRGAFQIRYSMEKVATLLSISRYSIYNYMDQNDTEPATLNAAS